MDIASGGNLIAWLGIGFCITQSAMFSGLNLAFFSVPRLRLEIEAANHNKAAIKVLKLRQDTNFLLSTILWGNVGINVLLTLLSSSVMLGVSAFLFSTIVITFLGEIIPQAYFSRHALKMASRLSPVLVFYQYLLFLVAKPSALMLNWLVGHESIHFFKENSLVHLISRHVEADGAEEIDYVEGTGAINFLTLDDIAAHKEGEPVHPDSIIALEHQSGKPVFPDMRGGTGNAFLAKLNQSGKKWIIFIDQQKQPTWVMDADGFLRSVVFEDENVDPFAFCHEPIVVRDIHKRIGELLLLFRNEPESTHDDVIDRDIILLWTKNKRIITGADILGRLLRGIANSPRNFPILAD